jgi:predicted dehydrogenase
MTWNRRRFCQHSLGTWAYAATSGTMGWALSAGPSRRLSANETISHAIIGCQIRGRAHAEAFSQLDGVQVTHVCDPDRSLAEALADSLEARTQRRPHVVADLRRVFQAEAVDTVSICTPNHWHALATLWALQADKDVYVEKPLSHTVEEGQRMVAAVARSQRVCQVGTQNRSHGGLRAVREFLQAGGLGPLSLARTLVYGRRDSIGMAGRYSPPPDLDYNLWLGPASADHLNRPQLHYDWHWVWDTGNGELGNNNIHYVDIVRWLIGSQGPGDEVLSIGGRLGYADAGQTPNTQMVVHRFSDFPIIQEVRGLPTGPFSAQVKDGWVISGREGSISGTSWFDPQGQLVKTFAGEPENHFANFIDSVRQRRPESLAAPVTEGHQSTMLCHLGNISHRVGRPASVQEIERRLTEWSWHPAIWETFQRFVGHLRENQVDLAATPLTLGPTLKLTPDHRFEDHWEANRLLSRSYRAPFELPTN